MIAIRQATIGRASPLPASLWRLLPGIALGAVLVGMVGASALITENHKAVSFVAASALTAQALAMIVLAAAWSVASSRVALRRPWSRSIVSEPSHIHIPRRSRGGVE